MRGPDLVLGPERLYRRPVIDEHDFHCGRYLDDNKEPIEVRIEAVLTDLPQEAELRFHRHLRRWDDVTRDIVDQDANGPPTETERKSVGLCQSSSLDAMTRRRMTSSATPSSIIRSRQSTKTPRPNCPLGNGRRVFGREQKRLCGFVFLRTLRTGSRALSLQRGSLARHGPSSWRDGFGGHVAGHARPTSGSKPVNWGGAAA